MRRKGIGFDFVRDYLDDNGQAFRSKWENNYQRFRQEFEWSEEDMETVFNNLKENSLVVSDSDTLKNPDFKSDTLYIPKNHWEEVSWMSAGAMKARLALQVWGLKKYYPVINDVFDNAIEKSMGLWDEVARLKEFAATHTNDAKQKVEF